MAQLLVRNLDDAVKKRLQRRAARHGRSTEEEARQILRAAPDQDEAEIQMSRRGTRTAQRFAGLDFVEELPELHGVAILADLGRA